MMPRPIFIIAEPEPEQALSVRKLVIETAKFNVITAHSADELRESGRLFPNANAVIIHSGLLGALSSTASEARKLMPEAPIIALSPSGSPDRLADHTVSSHDPHELVELLRKLFGDPRKAA